MELKMRINKAIFSAQNLGIFDITDESKVRFVIQGAGPSNVVAVRARLMGQPNFILLQNISGSNNQVVNVSSYEELEVECTAFDPSGDKVEIYAASFSEAGGSAIESIGVPSGDTITDISDLTFTSVDNSVTIVGDNTAKSIDFSVSASGSSYSPTTPSDWDAPIPTTAGEGLDQLADRVNDLEDNKINTSEKGAANGVAPLNSFSKIDSTYLPSYVDDVVEYANFAAFPITGETGKIYVTLDTNLTYRWSGSSYIQISESPVLSVNGEVGVVIIDKADVGLGNVDNTSDLNKPISTATQTALTNLENSFKYNQVVYVDKANTGTYTADGSINKPFKTIEAMFNAITDASASKRYACIIAPGTYTEANTIRLKGWIDLTPFQTDTVIITVSGGATLKWSNNNPGRVFIRDIGLTSGIEVLNDNPTGTSGVVLDLDNVDVPSIIFNGRGGGRDFFQLRNDVRISGNCTIRSAATTIFDSTLLGTLTMNDVGCVAPDSFGSAITAALRGNYIQNISISATTYDVYTDIYAGIFAGNLTIASNASSYPCYFNYDATSYPAGTITTTGTNPAVLVATSKAQAIRYTPAVSGNWSSPVPDDVKEALDAIVAQTASYGSLNGSRVLYVDASAGNDTTGTGSVLKPVQTLHKAVTLATNPSVEYLFIMSPGQYSGIPLTLPGNISLRGNASDINCDITLGVPAGSTINPRYVGVSFGNFVMDLTPAAVALPIFSLGGFSITRLDATTGPHYFQIFDANIDELDLTGTASVSNCLYTGTAIVRDNGTLLNNGCVIGISITVEPAGIINMIGCTFVGAISGSSSGPNTSTVNADSTSLNSGGAILFCNINNLDKALTVGYTINDTLYWISDPTNVSSALHELSERIYGLDTSNTEFYQLFEDMKEPTGFVNRTDSVMTFDNITRKLTLQPAVTEYSIYQSGVISVINFNLEVTIPNISGNYYIYIDSAGDLVYSTTFDISLITTDVYCAYIYWSSSDGAAVIFGDERHGITMDGTTHGYLHTTRGAQLVSGASIGYTIGGDTISLSDMQIKDEDITVNINNDPAPSSPFEQILSPIAQIPIIYREGATEWRKWAATNHPMLLQPGDIRASYNENVGGVWQLTEAPSNNKVLVTYIFATPSIEEPVIALLGQSQYNNIDEARGSASWDQISFGDLPSPEMKLLYTIYYETSSGFASTVKSQISHVSDLRFTHDREVSATVFNSDHANLSGLTIGDDHPQYHNDTRGDIRYYTKTQIDADVIKKAGTTAFTGNQSMGGNKLTNLANPVDLTDAVNLQTLNSAIGSTGDIFEKSFSLLNNQPVATDITQFLFSNAVVRSFEALVSVKITATSNLYETFEIRGIQKDSDWFISINSEGDNSQVILSITSTGQMQYISANYPGFVSGVLKFRAITTSV